MIVSNKIVRHNTSSGLSLVIRLIVEVIAVVIMSMEPLIGFEPVTYALRKRRSTN